LARLAWSDGGWNHPSIEEAKADMNHSEAAADSMTELRTSAIELLPTEPIDIRAWIARQDGAI
jgi:hypothetical protein